MTDVDLDPGCTLNKKIRNAQLAQYNFILGNLHGGFLYIKNKYLWLCQCRSLYIR